MVVVLSAVVLFAVYNMFEQSSSVFRVEDQTGTLISHLRFASEHIKRDVGRVGFLSTPNSETDAMVAGGPVCHVEASQPLIGVSVRRDGEENPITQTVFNPAINVNILPNSLTMFGDFWSQGPVAIHRVSGEFIELDVSSYNGGTPPESSVLAEWFPVGRLVRVQNRDGLEMYYYVAAFTENGGGPAGTWPVLRVNQSVPVVYGGGCGVNGDGTGALVNPVGYIRYRISQDTRAGAPADKYDLVREELHPDDGTVVPQSQLTIAEYAVDLQFYDFAFVSAPPPTPPTLTFRQDITTVSNVGGGGILGGSSTSTPHLLRALTFKLSLRTREEDPNVTHVPRISRWRRMTTFEVNQAIAGAARVRSTAGRVVLDNYITL